MKRKPLAFFRCMMRVRNRNLWTNKGDCYFYAFRYLRTYQNTKGLRPYK